LEHDPEKWIPVFRKDHAQITEMEWDEFRRKVIPLPRVWHKKSHRDVTLPELPLL
jgi:hypothetical protein